MVIPVSHFRIRPGHPLSFSVEDILDNLIDVDGHAQRPTHSGRCEKRVPHVVADIGVEITQAGEILELVLIFETGYLMRLDTVIVDGTCIEFHFLRERIRYYAHDVLAVFRSTFPVIFISNKTDQFVGPPFSKLEGSGSDRVTVKPAVADTEGFDIRILRIGFLL